MIRFFPYVKALVLVTVMMGASLLVSRSLMPGKTKLALPSLLQNVLPGGDSGEEAIEIATAAMTRVYSLQQRPPAGAESIGQTSDGRFWMVRLDMGPNRSSILCVVEPDAQEQSRRLVHFSVSNPNPSQAAVESVAKRGLWKASVSDAEWNWMRAAEGSGPAPTEAPAAG